MGIIFIVVGIFVFVLVFALFRIFSFDYVVAKGDRFLKTGQYKKAQSLFLNLVRKKPKNYKVLWGLAKAQVGLKFYREAIKTLKKIPFAESEKHNYFSMREFYSLFASAYEGIGEYQEALKYYVYLTKHGYDSWRVNFNIADVFFKMREIKKSVHYLNIALEKNPQATPVLSRLGSIYYKIKNYTMATKYLKKVLALDHNNVYAHIYLGFIYFQNEKYHEVIQYLEGLPLNKIPEEFATKYDYWFFLGTAYFKLEKYEKAYKVFLTFMKESQPDYENWSVALYRFALICEKIGHFDQSAELWAELNRINSNLFDVKLRYTLSTLYSKSAALKTFLFSTTEKFMQYLKFFIGQNYRTVGTIEKISDYVFDVTGFKGTEEEQQTKFLIRVVRNLEGIDKSILETFYSKTKNNKADRGVFYILNGKLDDEAKSVLERYPIDILTLPNFIDDIESSFEQYRKGQ